MKVIRTLVLLGLTTLGATLASAQPASAPAGPGASGPGAGPRASGPGPGPRAASGPGPGMRMGPGGQAGPHGRGRWGSDFTPGWTMMSPKERDEHRARMQGAKSYEECKTLQQQHHELMAARAKERGVTAPPAQPRRDACAGLKP